MKWYWWMLIIFLTIVIIQAVRYMLFMSNLKEMVNKKPEFLACGNFTFIPFVHSKTICVDKT